MHDSGMRAQPNQETSCKKGLEITGNNKTVLKEIGWKGVEWNHLARDKQKWWVIVNTTPNSWGP